MQYRALHLFILVWTTVDLHMHLSKTTVYLRILLLTHSKLIYSPQRTISAQYIDRLLFDQKGSNLLTQIKGKWLFQFKVHKTLIKAKSRLFSNIGLCEM
jgi:hypothetical protein